MPVVRKFPGTLGAEAWASERVLRGGGHGVICPPPLSQPRGLVTVEGRSANTPGYPTKVTKIGGPLDPAGGLGDPLHGALGSDL